METVTNGNKWTGAYINGNKVTGLCKSGNLFYKKETSQKRNIQIGDDLSNKTLYYDFPIGFNPEASDILKTNTNSYIRVMNIKRICRNMVE